MLKAYLKKIFEVAKRGDARESWRLGLSPEEIVIHMPHLTLAQVFEALSYYSDHQEKILEYMEKNKIPSDKIHPTLTQIHR